mgnify:CR=1 FL=1
MLKIENLYVQVGDKLILKGIDLEVKEREVYILLGPNGGGKTTLLHTIMGLPKYKVVDGKILLNGIDITNYTTDERARLGIGIMFQKPPTLRGVPLIEMATVISQAADSQEVYNYAKELNLSEHLSREVNYGFSGGEIKRSEVFQLLCQKPSLILLDEPESGVDLDNISLIGKTINKLLGKDGKIKDRHSSGIIVTHTGHILDYVNASRGYVLIDGKIVCDGSPRDLLDEIRKNGYERCLQCK